MVSLNPPLESSLKSREAGILLDRTSGWTKMEPEDVRRVCVCVCVRGGDKAWRMCGRDLCAHKYVRVCVRVCVVMEPENIWQVCVCVCLCGGGGGGAEGRGSEQSMGQC